MTHICVGKLTIIGSDNGLSPDRRQAIIWTNAGILLIGPLGTKFSEILIKILTFSFKKMRLKVLSAKRRPFCLGLNVLTLILLNLLKKNIKIPLQFLILLHSEMARPKTFEILLHGGYEPVYSQGPMYPKFLICLTAKIIHSVLTCFTIKENLAQIHFPHWQFYWSWASAYWDISSPAPADDLVNARSQDINSHDVDMNIVEYSDMPRCMYCESCI